MKAILVIDEMPKSCSDCWLHRDEYSDYEKVWEDICHNAEHECHVLSKTNYIKRPSWCPLQPMPQKKVVTVKRIDDIQSYSITEVADKISAKIILKTNEVFALGWNACIDAIIGDTDGTKGEITGETE